MTCDVSSYKSINRKLAFLIGNNSYKQQHPLECSINDANDVGTKLSSIDFEVTIGIDLTYEQMNLMIEQFLNRICPEDLVFFYFSGHGYECEGHNYLLAIDDEKVNFRKMIKHHAIDVQITLKRILNRYPSSVIFILDYCRNNLPLHKTKKNSSTQMNNLSTLKSVLGSFIAFACGADEIIVDKLSNQRNSIFTSHLLQNLTLPNLTIDEIMCNVCDGVIIQTNNNQCPERLSSLRRKIYLNKQIRSEELNPFTHIHLNIKWRRNGITIAGGNGRGNKLNQLSMPYGIYVDHDQMIYISDCYNHRILLWKYDQKDIQIIAGGNGKGNEMNQLNEPTNVIIDKQNNSLIIADRGNRRIIRYFSQNNTNGQIIICDIDCWGLAMDQNGYLYVSDIEKHEVTRWKIGDQHGKIVAGGNGRGNNLNQLNEPTSIFIDKDYSIYISDFNNHRVIKWIKDGSQGIVIAGGQDQIQLYYPDGLIVDQLGQIYVVDSHNHRIMHYSHQNKQGNIILGGNGEGKQSNQLKYPTGLSFDRYGNLYVVDSLNSRIQKFEIDP